MVYNIIYIDFLSFNALQWTKLCINNDIVFLVNNTTFIRLLYRFRLFVTSGEKQADIVELNTDKSKRIK